MKIVVVAIGRLKSGPEQDLVRRYRERAEALGRTLGLSAFSIVELPESRARREADRRAEEAETIRPAAGKVFAVFDERGPAIGSEAFAGRIRAGLEGGVAALTFVIGGPDGLDPALRAAAATTLSFGALTLPHQLVRILVAEQVYRAFTILAGHPYHRQGGEAA